MLQTRHGVVPRYKLARARRKTARQCGNDRKVWKSSREVEEEEEGSFSLTRGTSGFSRAFREIAGTTSPARFNGSKLAESELAGGAARDTDIGIPWSSGDDDTVVQKDCIR